MNQMRRRTLKAWGGAALLALLTARLASAAI